MRQRRKRWYNSGPNSQKIGQWLLIALLLLLVIITSSGSAYAYGYYQSESAKVQGLANQHISQTTHIEDRNGVALYDVYDQGVGGGRRTPVSYQDIPQVMQDAMISAEDHTFWTNIGIDPQGILRAATCGGCGGGSTITQQLIKNLTGDDQASLSRKIPEATLAVGLTQQYPKSKILEMYLNVAPFGSQDLGIEAAVEEYFHLMPQCKNFNCVPGIAQLDYDLVTKKHDPLLGLARASLLAGMPQKPVTNDPTLGPTSKQGALARQADVLNEMIGLGISVKGLGPITPEIAKQAEDLTAKMTFTRYRHIKRAPHFVDWIIGQMETALGNGDPNQGVQTFLTGGFNIRTTVDANLEDYVENAVKRHLTQPDYQMFPYGHYATLNVDNNVNDAAVVVMNSTTGEVLAMDGSTDYNSTNPLVGGQVDAAITGRAPGSTFKPIVYATTFQMGWYPGMVLPDFTTYFPNGAAAGSLATGLYHPPDYGGANFHWNINSTIRQATAMSLNVPAVKALSFAGMDNVLTNARRMGITSLNSLLTSSDCQGKSSLDCLGIATVLGTHNVPLLQLAGAYQTFADQGMHVPPQGILDIWDNYGHNLYHFDPQQVQETQVFSKQVAYMMTAVLSDEHARQREFLGDHDLSFWDWDPTCQIARAPYPDCQYHQVAAKTGTTDNFQDNLTIGYTPNVVVGVWAGNADGTPMSNVVGITGAAPIWHSVMEFVSGKCNTDTDNIPCPNLNRNALDFTQPNTFTQPDGLQIQCVSPVDGLGGTGDCDWMLQGSYPLQTGVVPMTMNPMNGNGNGNGN